MNVGLLVFLVLAVYFDIKTYKIPNALTVTGMAAGIIYRLYGLGPPGLFTAATDLIAGMMILFPLYLIRCLGAGDIKLLMVISTFLGWKVTLIVSFYSLMIGAVIGLLKGSILSALQRNNFKDTLIKKQRMDQNVIGPKNRTDQNKTDNRKTQDAGHVKCTIHYSIPILIAYLFCLIRWIRWEDIM